MSVRKIVPKSKESLKPSKKVADFTDRFVKQAMQDLFDTLADQQAKLDLEYPGAGGGVGLASNQIEYPYEAQSDNDPNPKPGFYPKHFIPPHIYVISIRPDRAAKENCEPVKPSVYINASFVPTQEAGTLLLEEGCLSIVGIKGLHVPRFKSGIVQAYNETGKYMTLSVNGFTARAHQHEIDHCHGKEYLNNMLFTDEEIQQILQWLHKNEKTETIINDKLICHDIEGVDVTAFFAWVEHEIQKRDLTK